MQTNTFSSLTEEMTIVIKDACCDWSSSDHEVKEPILDHVNLAIPKGSLVAVIGEVKVKHMLRIQLICLLVAI